MSTELYVILGHSFSDAKIEVLPSLLNDYTRGNAGSLRLRFGHGYSGGLQAQGDGWVWQMEDDEVDSEWAREPGVLVSGEHWAWNWNPERDGSFEQWFQENIKYGRLRLASTLSCDLDIGLQSVVLSPPIRWRNFFDPVVQFDLRRYARFLIGFFGGSCALYVPDDIDPGCEAGCKVSEGWHFDQITNWLHSQMPPAASLSTAELIETTYFRGMRGFQARGYYLDDFSDMKTE